MTTKNQTDGPMDVHKELLAKESKVKKYQRLVIGSTGLRDLITYELVLLFTSWIPGAMGLFLRSKFYPLVLQQCGKSVSFGTNVLLRHPNKISIGDDVVIDDNCLLDAKGNSNKGISIGSGVFIGRNSILSCQNGDIVLGNRVNIGFNTEIFSSSLVSIEENTLVAAYCYVIGGGHGHNQTGQAFADQRRFSKGVTIEKNAWLGAGVMVQDGVKIGAGALIGTGAVVTEDVPAGVVAVGIPARVRRAFETTAGNGMR
jgi:acetyltransferase-like isoleucine patch superfamily enzyme